MKYNYCNDLQVATFHYIPLVGSTLETGDINQGTTRVDSERKLGRET